MGARVFQQDYISVTSEPGSHGGVQTSAGEGLPVEFLSFLHGFIGFGDSPVQVQDLAMFQICFEFPRELLFVVLLQLLLDNCDDLRYLIVLVPAELGIDFFVAVVASVKIDETFQGCVIIILELVVGIFAFADIGHLLNHIGHDICN